MDSFGASDSSPSLLENLSRRAVILANFLVISCPFNKVFLNTKTMNLAIAKMKNSISALNHDFDHHKGENHSNVMKFRSKTFEKNGEKHPEDPNQPKIVRKTPKSTEITILLLVTHSRTEETRREFLYTSLF